MANELAATIQAAEGYRDRSTRAAAEATTSADPDQRRDLGQEAAYTASLAEGLEEQVGQLRKLDDDRATWYLHTVVTRVNADRAQDELATRHAGDPPADDRVTTAEWMVAHHEAMLEDDQHREITEADILDSHEEPTTWPQRVPTTGLDIRERAAEEPTPGDETIVRIPSADETIVRIPSADETIVRIPSADETSDAIIRAQRALAEVRNRTAAEAAREAEEIRSAQLARWHADDQAAEHGTEIDRGLDEGYDW